MIKGALESLNKKISKPQGVFFSFMFIGVLALISHTLEITVLYLGISILIIGIVLEIIRGK